LLDPADRKELVARGEWSFGLGPLEPLLRDPKVDEVMVKALPPVWAERVRRVQETAVRFTSSPTCARRSSGSSRRWAAVWTRPGSYTCD